jgi:hypothetical protein
MSKETRKRFVPQEKVAILRLHLLEHTPVSDLLEGARFGLIARGVSDRSAQHLAPCRLLVHYHFQRSRRSAPPSVSDHTSVTAEV